MALITYLIVGGIVCLIATTAVVLYLIQLDRREYQGDSKPKK